jgi:hypothetical protein
MKEATEGRVSIDFNAKVLEVMIEWMYLETAPVLSDLEVIRELFVASDQYHLTELKVF